MAEAHTSQLHIGASGCKDDIAVFEEILIWLLVGILTNRTFSKVDMFLLAETLIRSLIWRLGDSAMPWAGVGGVWGAAIGMGGLQEQLQGLHEEWQGMTSGCAHTHTSQMY